MSLRRGKLGSEHLGERLWGGGGVIKSWVIQRQPVCCAPVQDSVAWALNCNDYCVFPILNSSSSLQFGFLISPHCCTQLNLSLATPNSSDHKKLHVTLTKTSGHPHHCSWSWSLRLWAQKLSEERHQHRERPMLASHFPSLLQNEPKQGLS